MLNTAFLCPGMGAQEVGMGADFLRAKGKAADLFEEAKSASGIDIFNLCSLGPAEELSQPQNALPCLLTASVAAANALKACGVQPDCVAGFGCGELAAHVIANTIDLETAMHLATRCGGMTAMALLHTKGGMAAFEGMDEETALDMCQRLPVQDEILSIAAYDCPGRITLSGSVEAVERACEEWTAAGKQCHILYLGGACNSPLIEMVATNGMRPAVNAILFDIGEIPIYNNLDAQPFVARDVVKTLCESVTHPVLWRQIIERMIKDGVRHFYICGPDKDISSSVKRTAEAMNTNVYVHVVSNVEGLQSAC